MLDDDLSTFLNVWYIYYNQKDYKTWCKDNFIFEKKLIEIEKLKNMLGRSLKDALHLKIKIYENKIPPNFDNMMMNEPTYYIKKVIAEVYQNRIMNLLMPAMGPGRNPVYHANDIQYIIDKNVKNLTSIQNPCKTVLAFNVRKIKGRYFINHIVNIV